LSWENEGKGLSLAFFLIFFPVFYPAAGELSELFPLIRHLDSRDTGFRQYISDVEHNRRQLYRNRDSSSFAESLTIYQYRPGAEEDIYTLAARCNIPYSALASLNRMDHPTMPEGTLLLPSCPGIFLPSLPRSDFERLLAAARLSGDAALLNIKLGTETETFYFFPGVDFNSTERIFFLNSGFHFPLRDFRLTSAYGLRQSPITGNMHLHQGLDLAAPAGTDVFAAGQGTVTEIGENPVYGKYVVIKHGERWTSLYGHLQKVETTLLSPVRSGTLIGKVGSTGQSTGPHLHFELRENGKAQDPGKYLGGR
jgi:murein DD-endopeptidase MepM/ murein hydrolase activator NlpD